MSSIIKIVIDLLVSKGRDKLAKKLNDGDVTDQKFREVIVREIDDIKSKLDGLARKDLLASISLFREGIELLYDAFENASWSTLSIGKQRAVKCTAQVAAAAASEETFTLATKMRKSNITTLDDPTTFARVLCKAKERFEEARLEATKTFSNEALELSDRLRAMLYRLLSTVLASIGNPGDAAGACRVCLEKLHQLPAVKECFRVELEKGLSLRALFNKSERREKILYVCRVNRAIYNITKMVASSSAKIWTLPCVDTGREKVDPLRDERVAKALTEEGLEHCCVTGWAFVSGEDKPWCPWAISSNTLGEFLVADNWDKTVKVFESNGGFRFCFCPHENDDCETKLNIWDVVTVGHDDKTEIYLLVELNTDSRRYTKQKWEDEVQIFNKNAELKHRFTLKRIGSALAVGSKVIVLTDINILDGQVDVYEKSGEFVCSFGKRLFYSATSITATCNDSILAVDCRNSRVHKFTVKGQHIDEFNVSIESDFYYLIACHPVGKYIVLAGHERQTNFLRVAVFTVNGQLMRRIQLVPEVEVPNAVAGLTVTNEGLIAVVCKDGWINPMVLIVV